MGSISIGVGCKEGGAAWGVVCGERCVAGVVGDSDLSLICPLFTGYVSREAMSVLFFAILFSFTYMSRLKSEILKFPIYYLVFFF